MAWLIFEILLKRHLLNHFKGLLGTLLSFILLKYLLLWLFAIFSYNEFLNRKQTFMEHTFPVYLCLSNSGSLGKRQYGKYMYVVQQIDINWKVMWLLCSSKYINNSIGNYICLPSSFLNKHNLVLSYYLFNLHFFCGEVQKWQFYLILYIYQTIHNFQFFLQKKDVCIFFISFHKYCCVICSDY